MAFLGLYLAACGLLIGAGTAKLLRPRDTARAIREVIPLGTLAGLAILVRVLAATEICLGLIGLAYPDRIAALLVAASYAAFALFVLYRAGQGRLTGHLWVLWHAGHAADGSPRRGLRSPQLLGRRGRMGGRSEWIAGPAPTRVRPRDTAPRGERRLWLAGIPDHVDVAQGRTTAASRSGAGGRVVTFVDRASKFLEHRISRRSLIVRSAFAGSALATGGLEFLLKPGTAYAQCVCGSADCSCGDTCCAGYTEFCCVLNGGYNSCPANTIMGGWWMAEGSEYCDGPRYYMDCNAVCECLDGCSGGFPFCSTGCDGVTCGCAFGSCENYLTSCFQFRYGQCNQDVECIGRIVCRVVTCVPPWEVDPTCTTASAEDDGPADQNAACLGPVPTYPPPRNRPHPHP